MVIKQTKSKKQIISKKKTQNKTVVDFKTNDTIINKTVNNLTKELIVPPMLYQNQIKKKCNFE